MRALLRSRVVRWVIAAAAVGLVASVGAVNAAAGDTSAQYRLATASTGDVEQTVSTSGTVDPVNRADVAFGTDGTLADLAVAVGDQVTAGQPLGGLDTTALQAAVDAAEAELADATAAIEADEQGQVDTAQDAVEVTSKDNQSTAPSGATASAQQSGQPTDPALAGLVAQVKKQQQAVRTAQTAATEAITAAKSALATQTEKCADAYQPDTGASTEPTASEPATSEPATVEPSAQSSAQNAACSEALNAVTAAQDAVSQAQDTLHSTINDLAGSLERAVAEVQKSASSSGANQPSGSSDAQGSGDLPQNGGQSQNGAEESPSSGSSSAAGIASGQARIDRAEADLLAAEQSLTHANLTAPITGEVASVEMAEGDSVTAGDTAVVLIGSGAAVIETTVPVERISDIEVGLEATVTPSGANEGVPGTVTHIGRLADTASDSVAYPVTVTVDEPTTTMLAGSTASVSIVVATIDNVVTVPTSAVTRGGRDTVTVYNDGQATSRQVTVGAVGPLRTEIQEGVAAGEQVVLADLDEPLPSAEEPTGGDPGGSPSGGFTGGPGGGPMGRPAGR